MATGGRKKATERREAPPDYRLLAEFRRVLRQFLAFSESAAREAGLTPQQHQALLAIEGFEDDRLPTVGDLAKRLVIRHHSAVGLVDRLAREGLVARQDDATDRRRVTLTLTKKAERLLAGLSAAHRDELRRLAPLLKTLLARIEG